MQAGASAYRKAGAAAPGLLALVVAVALVVGCNKTLEVTLEIAAACDQPGALDGIKFLTIRTEGSSLDTPREVTYTTESGQGSLEGIPVTADARLTILGHTSDVNDPADVAGGQGSLDLTGKSGTALATRVIVGAVDTFVGTSQGPSPTTCSGLSQGRQGHSATALMDGRVLIAGGEVLIDNELRLLRSTEIYDPSDGTFREGVELGAGRAYHSATLLKNGRVLLCGGLGVQGGKPAALATCAIYDHQEKKLGEGPAMSLGRMQHSATLLGDGRVVIAGGRGLPADYYLTTEVYDDSIAPAGGFLAAPNLMVPRGQHTATALADGKSIVFAGGRDKLTVRGEVEIWDVTHTKAAGSFGTARYAHAAGVFADGRIVFGGGFTTLTENGNPEATASLEVFDPASSALTCPAGLALSAERGQLFAAPITSLPGGRSAVLFGGGTRLDGAVTSAAELVTAGLGKSCQEIAVRATKGKMKLGRTRAEAVVLSGGDVLVVGGSSAIGAATTAALDGELYVAPR